MRRLRLVADDLTGALDSAAQFVVGGRPIPVFLRHDLPAALPDEFAVDGASREGDGQSASGAALQLAPLLAPAKGTLSYKKVDSLLRGHPGVELAATLGAIGPRYCIIAPAFPYHGRTTRGGRQFLFSDGIWHRTGEDLMASLGALGVKVQLRRSGDAVPEGTSLWDAETDEELRHVVRAAADLPEPPLWCGSGGLAGALASSAAPSFPRAGTSRPLLGIFGSDHPATGAQLRACAGHVMALPDCGDASTALVAARLADAGVALLRFDLGSDLGRAEASGRIGHEIYSLTHGIARPHGLLVVGGETLRALCLALGVDHLAVMGQVIPGVPLSRMMGGRWDQTEVISKSGAFGDEALVTRILSGVP